MVKWLRKYFGRCKDRWFHDWNDEKTKRNCKVCGANEVVVGYYQLDSDLGTIRQWERV